MVVFSSGQTAEQLNKIQTYEVESRFSGWLGVFINGIVILAYINQFFFFFFFSPKYLLFRFNTVWFADDTHRALCIEIRGTDSSVRVRQIKVLGIVSGESLAYGRQYSYSTIQHRQCENETLKVFRSITFQVRYNWRKL